jgi:hypothetical protein
LEKKEKEKETGALGVVGFGDAREDRHQVRNCGLGNSGQFLLLLLLLLLW